MMTGEERNKKGGQGRKGKEEGRKMG